MVWRGSLCEGRCAPLATAPRSVITGLFTKGEDDFLLFKQVLVAVFSSLFEKEGEEGDFLFLSFHFPLIPIPPFVF
jgi:hypothetical protein